MVFGCFVVVFDGIAVIFDEFVVIFGVFASVTFGDGGIWWVKRLRHSYVLHICLYVLFPRSMKV